MTNSYQVMAANGAIIYIGDDGRLIANTGDTAASGVVALGVDGSTLASGDSRSDGRASSPVVAGAAATQSHDNGSLSTLVQAHRGTGTSSTAISGFEDHSVSVIGNDQIITYDDSNVFIGRDGLINANTGDTDSSGLNAVDVWNSTIRSGNSGDGEGGDDGDESDDDEAVFPARPQTSAPQPGAVDEAGGETTGASSNETSTSSDDEDGTGNDEALEDGTAGLDPSNGQGHAAVTDEGASIATGSDAFVIGADGFDDVSIRSQGNGNIVTYDDSNVVIGGTGQVNAQIGDSDTGGAVVMGIHDSNVQAGCEGDLCNSK